MAKVWARLACLAALAVAGQAAAQIAPGIRAPLTQLDAFKQSYGLGCFMSVADRPWAGITGPLLGMEGEGLRVESELPDWFLAEFPMSEGVRLASLDSPEGPVWIRYERASHSCIVGAAPSDPAGFKAALLQGFPDAPGNWRHTPEEGNQHRYSGRIEGATTRWFAKVLDRPATPNAVFVEISATNVQPLF